VSTTIIRGLGVSPGIAIGPVARMALPTRPPADEPAGADPAADVARVEAALEQVATWLDERATMTGGEAGGVLAATAALARDPELLEAVGDHLAAGAGPATSLDAAIEAVCATLANVGGRIGERAGDLRDVGNRALAALLGVPMPGIPQPGHPYVLVARDLAPADTATLDPALVLGIVIELGGPTGHTAILAKGLGVPAVASCGDLACLADGMTVVVDGQAGLVTATPDETEIATVRAAGRRRQAIAESDAGGPGSTADGTPVHLLVNVATLEDARRAAASSGEGVGLFRTEGLFLQRATAPTVAEQAAAYGAVFACFGRARVVVRTLDAGADKPLAFVDTKPEENPALGVRGYRTSRRHPGLLADQLEAIAQAARATGADVRVMAPMISTPAEARAFTAAARAHGLAQAGVMIEVPAAALRADELLRCVDFVSLGTNDLAQYAFAADRTQGELADLLDPWQPALLDLIALVGDAGDRTGRSVSVCGEAAGDPVLACVLVGAGVRALSMASGLLPAVRAGLRAHTLAQCREMAAAARAAPDATAARAAVRQMLSPTVAGLI
jgi:phosphoenolpyruvate-protein phosphotransferase (PTS system enzyme I)